MKKDIFKVRWVVSYFKPSFELHTVETESMTKFQALKKYYEMIALPKSKDFRISSLSILKNGEDITCKINEWLNSNRVN